MADPRLPDEVRKAVERTPVMFWTCLNHDHKFVTWTGDVARCDDCGLTSEMTDEWMRLIRAAAGAEIAERIAAAVERSVCAPGEQCKDRFCPDCVRHRQAKADAALARKIAHAASDAAHTKDTDHA